VISHEERNRIILRRTLSAVAWICAVWTALLAAPLTGFGTDDIRRRGWLMLGHAVLLAASGVGLWRPRSWGWLVTLIASLASAAFVAGDLLRGHPWAAVVDGLFPACSLAVYIGAREPRLDRPKNEG
jgi:hypothetical protein